MAKNSYVDNLYQTYCKNPDMVKKYLCAGIYGLAINGQIVYVGKSNNILHRMAEHYADVQHPEEKEHKYEILNQASKRNIKYTVWKLYKASSTNTADLEKELGERESFFIHKYAPPLNYQIPSKEDYHSFTVQKRAQTITLDELLEEINYRNGCNKAVELKNQKVADELLTPVLNDPAAVAGMIAQLSEQDFAKEWEKKTGIHSSYELGYDIGKNTAGAIKQLGISRILIAALLKSKKAAPDVSYIREHTYALSYALGLQHCSRSENKYSKAQSEIGYKIGFCDTLSALLLGSKSYSGDIKKRLESAPNIEDKELLSVIKYCF